MLEKDIERMRELEKALDSRWGNRFHGSKAQRKNAERELRKLQAAKAAEEALNRAARIQFLEGVISGLECALEDDYRGFWWEIPSIRDPRQVIEDLDEAKRELANLIG